MCSPGTLFLTICGAPECILVHSSILSPLLLQEIADVVLFWVSRPKIVVSVSKSLVVVSHSWSWSWQFVTDRGVVCTISVLNLVLLSHANLQTA